MSDEESKGFKVTDRRIDFEEEGDGGQDTPDTPAQAAADDAAAADADADTDEVLAAASDEAPAGVTDDEPGPPPMPMSFSTLLVSLGTSALAALGDVPEPIAGQTQKNLPMARQTIDILGVLEEKTKGNLTEEEEKLLRNLLYDLHVRYVQAESSGG